MNSVKYASASYPLDWSNNMYRCALKYLDPISPATYAPQPCPTQPSSPPVPSPVVDNYNTMIFSSRLFHRSLCWPWKTCTCTWPWIFRRCTIRKWIRRSPIRITVRSSACFSSTWRLYLQPPQQLCCTPFSFCLMLLHSSGQILSVVVK